MRGSGNSSDVRSLREIVRGAAAQRTRRRRIYPHSRFLSAASASGVAAADKDLFSCSARWHIVRREKKIDSKRLQGIIPGCPGGRKRQQRRRRHSLSLPSLWSFQEIFFYFIQLYLGRFIQRLRVVVFQARFLDCFFQRAVKKKKKKKTRPWA